MSAFTDELKALVRAEYAFNIAAVEAVEAWEWFDRSPDVDTDYAADVTLKRVRDARRHLLRLQGRAA